MGRTPASAMIFTAFAAFAFLSFTGTDTMAQTASAAIVKELAPTGKLRAAINFGNPVLAQKDPATGDARGVTGDLARELAKRLGVQVEFVGFDTAGKVSGSAKDGIWDICFLAIDPVRAADIAFTGPYVVCLSNGCMAEYEASDELIAKMKSGQNLHVQGINGSGQPISIPMPLADFAKAYDGPPIDPKELEQQEKK